VEEYAFPYSACGKIAQQIRDNSKQTKESQSGGIRAQDESTYGVSYFEFSLKRQ
jgi:hypothetical protein